jgi:hypothetical protein
MFLTQSEHRKAPFKIRWRVVGSIKDVFDTDLGYEVSQTFFAKDHRVDIKLAPEILARLFL